MEPGQKVLSVLLLILITSSFITRVSSMALIFVFSVSVGNLDVQPKHTNNESIVYPAALGVAELQ